MMQAAAMLMVLTLSIGIWESGMDLMQVMVRLAQVATEKLTMNQIGKSIMMQNITLGRKLTFRELPEFLKQNITRGGKNVTVDAWGSKYYLEIDAWRGTPFKRGGDEFIVCSPGPDKKWWNQDDELWYNFYMPDKLLFRSPSSASDEENALAKVNAFRKKTEEGLSKLKGFLASAGVSSEQEGSDPTKTKGGSGGSSGSVSRRGPGVQRPAAGPRSGLASRR